MLAGELTLHHREHPGAYTLFVGGELDMATARELVETVAQLVAQGVAPLTLDLGALTFMDSTGLRGIFAIRDLCEEYQCELALTLGEGHVQRVFELTGTQGVLPLRGWSSGEQQHDSYANKRRRFAEGAGDGHLPSVERA